VSRTRLRSAAVGTLVLGTGLTAVTLVASGGSAQLERLVTDFLITAGLVVALQAFVGNSGIVSFGHMAFAGIGAYTAALLTIPPAVKEQALPELPAWVTALDLGLIPAVLSGAVVAAVIAATVGGAMARMTETGFAMATLALLVLVHTVLANWDSVTRGGYGIYGIPDNTTLWIALVALVAIVAVARVLRASQTGLRLQATREDAVAATASGISVPGSRFGGWVLSAALMGVGGALLAQHLLAFDPDQFFFVLTFSTLAMLVLGGRESVTGAVVGAGAIAAVTEVLRRAELGFGIGSLHVPELPGLSQLVVAVLIILVLVFRPAGLLGRSEADDLAAAAPWLRRRDRDPAGGSDHSPPPPVDGRSSATEAILRVEGIAMSFAGLQALRGVTLELAAGEILGLIGPNGSGKTTLLNVISGLLRPTRGSVRILGTDTTGWPSHRVARLGVARTFQTVRLFAGLTVVENVLAAAPRRTFDADVAALLELFDLTAYRDDRAGTLPYGVQRRVEAARAAVRRPAVLLLDEPAAGMNEVESEQMLQIIARARELLDASVIVIDHDLRLVLRISNRVHVLNEGSTIAEGSPEFVSRNPKVLEAYLGTARPVA
jgi:branched-chain amino acid transport system permease protein